MRGMGNMDFGDLIQEILGLAKHYNKNPKDNPPMEQREVLLERLKGHLLGVVESLELDRADLKVGKGGRQANYSPLAWVRVYDPRHAPTAMNGFYVVLLFSTDGSSVYLSLNQGTSEFRSNAMRPIMNDELLLNRAASARLLLSDWKSAVKLIGLTAIDLAADDLDVGPESKRRIRNYELGNIYAYEYRADDPPSDQVFADGLSEMLDLLSILQDGGSSLRESLMATSKGSGPSRRRANSSGKGQGRQLDPEVRKLIELTAEDRAEEHYQGLGWEVERVGSQKLGYDLRCRRDHEKRYVEVKGTSGRGGEVILTPNEVKYCRDNSDTALVIVSEIVADEDKKVVDRGRVRIIDPWDLDDSRLIATEYSYRVT